MCGMTRRLAFLAFMAGVTAILAGCTSHPHPPAPPPVTSKPAPATPTHAVLYTAETCQALTNTDVLRSAEGFVLVAGVVNPGDVSSTVNVLGSIQREASGVFQDPLLDIVNALQNLDYEVSTLGASPADLSAVQPAAATLAALCRARHLPVPSVLP